MPFKMTFGLTGDYKTGAEEGWSDDPNDKTHTWADGHVSKIRLMMEFAKRDRLLEVDVIPLTTANLTQDLFVFLNGGFVAYWSVKHPARLSAKIETSHFNTGDNLLAFVFPKAICPLEAGLGDDRRTLGLAFRSLSFSEL